MIETGDFADILAEEIKNEIDREVLGKILINQGWTLVTFNREPLMSDLGDMYIWINDNTTAKHVDLLHAIVFESAEDAMLFKIRWAGK
jgi:hypothetical protein